ncbi:hypothetical protein AB0E10_25375 [Streptomyces sp. NPDC048045]
MSGSHPAVDGVHPQSTQFTRRPRGAPAVDQVHPGVNQGHLASQEFTLP